MSEDKSDDQSLFTQAMQDVRPLKQKHLVENKENKATHRQQKQIQLLRQMRQKKRQNKLVIDHEDLPQATSIKHPVSAYEKLFYASKGVRAQELAKLKASDYALDGVLDLHGYTQETAEQKCHRFIKQCEKLNKRFIRIIHGKGNNSTDAYPVIKNCVNQMLGNYRSVIAFTSAPDKDGGSGAVNVLLKSK